MDSSKRVDRRALAGILFLGLTALLVRLIGLGREPLSVDEFYSLRDSSFLNLFSDRPAYYFFMYGWRFLSGSDSPLFYRFPSVLFGVLSVWALYVTGRELFNRKTGFLAALLLSVSAFHIYNSQLIRMYTFVTFFTLLSVHGFFLLCRAESLKHWIYYLAATFLAILSHPFVLFIPVCQVIYLLAFVRNRSILKKLFLAGLALVLVVFLTDFREIAFKVLAKLSDILEEYRDTGPVVATHPMPVPTPGSVARTFLLFGGLFRTPLMISAVVLFFIIPFLLALFPRGDSGRRAFTKDRKTWFCALSILLPIGTIFLLSQVILLYTARYFIFVLPLFLLLVAHAVSELRPAAVKGLFVAGAVGFSLFSAFVYYREVSHPDMREITDRIVVESEKDVVVTTVYFGEMMIRPYAKVMEVHDTVREGLEKVIASCGKASRVYLFSAFQSSDEELLAYLRSDFRPVETRIVEAVNLFDGDVTPRYTLSVYRR